jgi:hypothetical protein
VEFEVDRDDYRRFKGFAESRHLPRDDALRAVMIKGMEAYWPQQLAYMVNNHEELKKLLEEYNRDNDLLRSIYSQNNELRKLLDQNKEPKRGG